jgi:hypothetical protein
MKRPSHFAKKPVLGKRVTTSTTRSPRTQKGAGILIIGIRRNPLVPRQTRPRATRGRRQKKIWTKNRRVPSPGLKYRRRDLLSLLRKVYWSKMSDEVSVSKAPKFSGDDKEYFPWEMPFQA